MQASRGPAIAPPHKLILGPPALGCRLQVRELGRGAAGVCVLFQSNKTGELFAVKMMHRGRQVGGGLTAQAAGPALQAGCRPARPGSGAEQAGCRPVAPGDGSAVLRREAAAASRCRAARPSPTMPLPLCYVCTTLGVRHPGCTPPFLSCCDTHTHTFCCSRNNDRR